MSTFIYKFIFFGQDYHEIAYNHKLIIFKLLIKCDIDKNLSHVNLYLSIWNQLDIESCDNFVALITRRVWHENIATHLNIYC